jgi:hypothetical protein
LSLLQLKEPEAIYRDSLDSSALIQTKKCQSVTCYVPNRCMIISLQ